MAKLFAFWRYSFQSYTGIPGFLGAPVVEVKANGDVAAEGYTGYRFTPVKILPIKEGRALSAKIERLRKEYREAHKAVDREFKKKLDDLLKVVDT